MLLAPGAVEVKFKINEGPPMILKSFAMLGMDSVPEKTRIIRDLPVREGGGSIASSIDAAADTIRERLHNNGYPRAECGQPLHRERQRVAARGTHSR